ncbi:hypothetical protein M407DRAFT_20482 [Tulasnella calospora MUT 4182]|uniref:F-box domain-containing protein n=1 Tax=Tulasnella calospora MUT 4182 TaxID=1051891 RepID=A0A0C3M9P9_9AGAM|nr:hypothetical protein M407DRAFT_20482 [Tulasnella calospora MUT 4182]
MDLLYHFEKKLDAWINKISPGATLPTQIVFWLEFLRLAIWLEILKLAGAAAPPALIHKLPTELIIEILLSAFEDTFRSPTHLQPLASVCKYWRHIILSVPRFWHVIDTSHGRHSCPLVLRRNRVGPLDVYIRGSEASRSNTDLILRLIPQIALESQRIHSLNFTVHPGASYFQRFFQTTSLPSLTSLTVAVKPQTTVPFSIHIGDGAPFRHLNLDGVTIPWTTPRLHGLETLSLSNLHHDIPTIAQLHHILSSTPFLRYLSISNWNAQLMPGYWTTQEISPVTLPLLTDVEVRSLPEVIHPRLISMFNLPSLKNVVWMAVDPRDWPLEPGPALLRMSAQCIKASPEIVISGLRWSWSLNITSKKWTNTPIRRDAVEPCNSVNLSIRTKHVLRLMRQLAALLNGSHSVLFETDSKNSARRVRKLFLRSGVFFQFSISRPQGFWWEGGMHSL